MSTGVESFADELRDALDYDPETGIFTWRQSRGNVKAGYRAGGVWRDSRGRAYLRVRLGGKLYYAHRLAFLFVTGKWPKAEVDHKDGDGLNNRWDNLRAADQSQNMRNRGPQKNNTTGLKGVTCCFGGYRARIKVGGKEIRLGKFATAEEAYAAYCAAAEKYHGEFARWQR